MKDKSLSFYVCVLFLAGLIAAALFADWFAPYLPREEERTDSFHPPTRIHFWGKEGNFYPRPFVYRSRVYYDQNLRRIYKEDPSVKYFLKFGRGKLLNVERPAKVYLFGADSRGRDLFSRLLYGARISLSIGFLGALIAALVGFLIGGISGYYGGKLDQCLMRLAEFFIMIPAFYFLLALRSALPPQLGSRELYVLIVAILSFIGWGGIARVIRGMVFSIRESDFLMAAKVLGRGDFEILVRHVLPQTYSYLGLVLSVSIPGYILGESALSLLGLGIQEPDVSWGNLLVESLSVAHLKFHPWILAPGVMIFATAFCFNVLGDVLRKRQVIFS